MYMKEELPVPGAVTGTRKQKKHMGVSSWKTRPTLGRKPQDLELILCIKIVLLGFYIKSSENPEPEVWRDTL